MIRELHVYGELVPAGKNKIIQHAGLGKKLLAEAEKIAKAMTGKQCGERPGEFGPEVHPWLGTAQHLHVLVAPILVFTLGMMVRGHLWSRLQSGAEGRRTGLGAAILIAPMVISGVGIQVEQRDGQIVIITPNPCPVYKQVAYLINKFRVNCRRRHT